MSCPFENEIKNLREKAENRDYWIEKCSEYQQIQEDWCEGELKKVCELLGVDTAYGDVGNLHDRLQELYEKFRVLRSW